jgi:hypothetical protein
MTEALDPYHIPDLLRLSPAGCPALQAGLAVAERRRLVVGCARSTTPNRSAGW